MALTNSQYDTIMRNFQERRLRHEKELQKKLEDAYKKYPRLSEIDDSISALSMKKARILLKASAEEDFDLNRAINELKDEKKVLLELCGFKDGRAIPAYDCMLCSDTGIIDSKKCICFKRAEIELLYSQSRLDSILDRENFDSFSLEWYSDTDKNEANDLSSRQTAKIAYNYSRDFVDNFSEKHGNICFWGKTGVGKTFLTHCIAKALMDKGISVLYLTAFDLFKILEDNAFHQNDETIENTRLIFESELLIIDDLGANINNSFISSSLFHCINERIIMGKSTVISTNLSVSELYDAYTERVVSRIISNYQIVHLIGDDIRIKKRLKGAKNGRAD